MWVKKKGKGDDRHIRQNENFYWKKMKKMYRIIVYLLIKENLYLKSYLAGSKINMFILEGLSSGGGGGVYT